MYGVLIQWTYVVPLTDLYKIHPLIIELVINMGINDSNMWINWY